MIKYSWEVLQMECFKQKDNLENVAFKILSRYVATSGSVSKVFSNVTNLPSPSTSTFIPYYSLTKNNIVEWIEADLGPEKIQSIKYTLKNKIETEMTPILSVSLPIPWKVDTPIIRS